MFIGHFAVGFAAKRVAPKTSLGAFFAAVQLPDLLWPLFLLTGLEEVRIEPGHTAFTPLAFTDYPISHSLLTTIGWAVAAGLIYGVLTRYRTGALVVGACVLSHWLLDVVVHRPDLPLYPGSETLVGLGLWNAVGVTIVLEGLMFVAGVWLYLNTTQPRNRVGTYALWGLLALLVFIYAGNVFGPPPEDTSSLAVFALGLWLLPPWAFWVDRNRASRRPQPRAVS